MGYSKGTIIDNYKIIDKIHTGRRSDIYFAENTRDNKKIALKIFHADAFNHYDIERWSNRIIKLLDLDHGNIIKYHSIFKHENNQCLAMEFSEGQSLAEMLAGFDTTPEKSIEIISSVIDALDFANNQDLVHGRLNPSHIIIDLEGRVKLLGFDDISIISDDWKSAKAKFPKYPEYLAPEIINNENIDSRADQFSVGTILYRMITGDLPFSGDNNTETMELILQHTPTVPSKILNNISIDFDKIISRLLGKDSDNRYHCMADIKTALESVRTTIATADTDKKPVDWWNRYVVPAAVIFLAILAIIWLIRK